MSRSIHISGALILCVIATLCFSGNSEAQHTPGGSTGSRSNQRNANPHLPSWLPRPAKQSPEFVAALDAEKASLPKLGALYANSKQLKERNAALEALQQRLATRLKRPLSSEERASLQMAIQPFIVMGALQAAAKDAAPMFNLLQGMTQAPPADVAQALAGEQAAIAAAAAARDPRRGQPLVIEITKRIAARTKRAADDNTLYGWVTQAVQTARVTRAMAPGGAAYQSLPPFLQAGLNGSLTQGFLDLAKVEPLAIEGKVDEAVRILHQNVSQTNALLSPVFIAGSPADASNLLQTMDSQVNLALAVAQHAPTHQGAVALAFALQALRKAKILELEQRVAAGLAGAGNEAQEARRIWATTRTLIAETEFQRAYGIAPGAIEAEDFAKLRQVESDVQRRVAGQAKGQRSSDASFDLDTLIPTLRRALPKGERLLSSVRYGSTQAPTGERYAAFVLDEGHLSFNDLGPAAAIDSAVDAYLDALDTLDGSAPSLATKMALAGQLHTLAFAPVEARLNGSTAVRVAADGALQLIPFAALHDGTRWLVERYPFSYFTSERETLGSFTPPVVVAPPAVVSWSPTQDAAATADPKLSPNDLPPLPGVAQEAVIVAGLLPGARRLEGAAASDWTMQKVVSPSVLHIAAHGALLGAGPQSSSGRGVALIKSPAAGVPAVNGASAAGSTAIDPLIRSAIVLSPNASPKTDGFLTAYEVTTMNLFGTEMVVLSACETGRGDATRLEGVRGLRAAFFSAGAKSLVASLWHVSDTATVELMRDFYANLAKKQGRRDALHEAMQQARKRSADPSTWAAFLLLGETGPLATFGAAVAAVNPNETAAARESRALAFRMLESGRKSGSGSWTVGTNTESLQDSYVEDGLGPDRNNLRINLVGAHTAISMFVVGYRGRGSYPLGARGNDAAIMVHTSAAKTDASALDPDVGMTRVYKGTLTLSGGGTASDGSSAPLVGSFSLSLGGSEIKGQFQL